MNFAIGDRVVTRSGRLGTVVRLDLAPAMRGTEYESVGVEYDSDGNAGCVYWRGAAGTVLLPTNRAP